MGQVVSKPEPYTSEVEAEVKTFLPLSDDVSYVTVVGSRRFSEKAAKTVNEVGLCLAAAGLHGRSGGAPGADMAWEDAWREHWSEVELSQYPSSLVECNAYWPHFTTYVPWPGYESRYEVWRHERDKKRRSHLVGRKDGDGCVYVLPGVDELLTQRALKEAQRHTTADHWRKLRGAGQLLAARNILQVRGHDPRRRFLSKALVYWVEPPRSGGRWVREDGSPVGGTGLTVRYAKSRGVPCYDLRTQKDELLRWLDDFVDSAEVNEEV